MRSCVAGSAPPPITIRKPDAKKRGPGGYGGVPGVEKEVAVFKRRVQSLQRRVEGINQHVKKLKRARRVAEEAPKQGRER